MAVKPRFFLVYVPRHVIPYINPTNDSIVNVLMLLFTLIEFGDKNLYTYYIIFHTILFI
jgi:hypothetical protein